MAALWLGTLLALASPVERTKVLVLKVSAGADADADLADRLTSLLTQEIARRLGHGVAGQPEIDVMLTQEQMKMMVDCDSSSCAGNWRAP